MTLGYSKKPSDAHRQRQEVTMTDPIIAQKAPYATNVTAGQSYFWCACGKSAKQPFCDGSHKDTGITPVKYEATETRQVFFCGCKASSKQPMCDGSHSKL
jgi:CDGSH-type Zn-finger protein